MIEFEPATAETVSEFYGKSPPVTVRAWVMRVDGRVTGIGGISYVGTLPVVFSDWRPEMRKRDAARAFRFLEARFREWRGRLFSPCGNTALLDRLGFRSAVDVPGFLVRLPC